MDDLTNSTPGSGGAATAEMPPDTTTGTVPSSGEATGVAPAGEETFTRVDPKTLPPQLRQTYENMNRDYKEKTTKLSETVKAESAKAAEAYREKATLYEQIASQEEFVKQWNEYVQKSQASGQQVEGDPVLSQMKQQIQEMNQKLQMTEMLQVTEAFAEAQDEKGQPIHPDFDQLNEISIGQTRNGKESENFSLLKACVELAQGNNPQEKLANGYKAAKSVRDAIFEEGKKAGMGRLQAKAQNGTIPPSNSTGETLSTTEKKPKNAHEALALARKGVMVSRD